MSTTTTTPAVYVGTYHNLWPPSFARLINGVVGMHQSTRQLVEQSPCLYEIRTCYVYQIHRLQRANVITRLSTRPITVFTIESTSQTRVAIAFLAL